MKKFFSAITYEKENGAGGSLLYAIDKSCYFTYDRPTSNPIFPFIYNNVRKGEEIRVYPIKYPDPESYVHLEAFMNELDAIKHEIGFVLPSIRILDAPPEADGASLVTFSKELIEQIDDGDTLFVDISNGARSLALSYWIMIHYAYKARRNISLGAVSCASLYEKPSPSGEAGALCTHTSLFMLSNIITNISGVDDPDALIKRLLGNLEKEESLDSDF
jgi:hypothetical protein